MQQGKMLSEEDLQIAEKRREAKGKGKGKINPSECESWTIDKAEHERIDAFELWCWRRLLRVPWTARRSNQCILREISPE